MHEFLRGAIRLHILHHTTKGRFHGAWLAAELGRHGYAISPGTLYPTLHRMEEEGLITSQREVMNGHAVRVYRATKAGRTSLDEGRRVLQELADELLDGAAVRARHGHRRSLPTSR